MTATTASFGCRATSTVQDGERVTKNDVQIDLLIAGFSCTSISTESSKHQQRADCVEKESESTGETFKARREVHSGCPPAQCKSSLGLLFMLILLLLLLFCVLSQLVFRAWPNYLCRLGFRRCSVRVCVVAVALSSFVVFLPCVGVDCRHQFARSPDSSRS